MQLWFETVGIVAVLILGLLAGLHFSRYKRPVWLVGYTIPLFVLLCIGFLRHFPKYSFVPGFSLILGGRNEFTLLALVVPMLFGTLLPRVETRRLKILLSIFLLVVSANYCVCPFLLPALLQGIHAKLRTTFDQDGICLQTRHYTCGPAAAVTALKQLGVDADEGLLAVQARTSPTSGTPDDWLCAAIERLCGSAGLRCEYRCFDSVDSLKGLCPVVATIRYAPLVDHYVTILEVNSDHIVVGDPITGKEVYSFADFRKKWRAVGIIIQHDGMSRPVALKDKKD
ncbi:MAG: hypothetical protein JXA82_12925 [Sedimentisphaerales bacterium]|nr:hypothetical protein [Sedimentisphaerales bacterium]